MSDEEQPDLDKIVKQEEVKEIVEEVEELVEEVEEEEVIDKVIETK